MTINCWNSANPIELSKGGTNATSMATSSGIVKYDGTKLVTSTTALIDASNIRYNTLQPSFFVFLTNSILNVTGDGTVYTVIFDTEVTDQGNNFDISTGIFTAPVTGKYLFQFTMRLTGGVAITSAIVKIVTTSATYTGYCLKPVDLAGGITTGILSVIANMTATDTASFAVQTTDTGKVDDLLGSASGLRTYASGCLLC